MKQDYIFTTQEVADLFGVSKEAIRLWHSQGAPKAGRDQWNLKDLIKWRYDAETSPAARKAEAIADIKETQAKMEAIRVGELKSRYIDRETVAHDIRRLRKAITGKLMLLQGEVVGELSTILTGEALSAANAAIKREIGETVADLNKASIAGS